MHTASSWALGHAGAWKVSDGWLPDNTNWQTVRMRRIACDKVFCVQNAVAYTGIALACKRKISHLELKNKSIAHSMMKIPNSMHVHQLSDGRHQDDDEEELVVVAGR